MKCGGSCLDRAGTLARFGNDVPDEYTPWILSPGKRSKVPSAPRSGALDWLSARSAGHSTVQAPHRNRPGRDRRGA